MTLPAEIAEFIRVCRDSALTERSGSQSHFIALCRLLGVKPPLEEDPRGEWFAFEKGAKKTGGGDGWADVWRRHYFAWEYKGKHKDLKAALRQLQQYALALENPQLLIVSDMETIEIHTNFPNTINVAHRLTLDDLADPAKLNLLRWAFLESERLRPARTREAVTHVAATLLGGLAQALRQRGHPPQPVAHFITLGLRTLKDIEHQVMLEAEALGLQRGFPAVGPEAAIGIEINPYAAELARLTVWIGEIQWMLGHGYSLNDQPILKPLNSIECQDALLTKLPSPACGRGVGGEGAWGEAAWPVADAIVGNPPFLGDKKQLAELGDDYVKTMRQIYAGRVPGGADLVCYWFEKARAQIEAGQAQRAGLVATNSIRGGANRKVLERIRESSAIFNAWSDEPWINEGAAVRVSLVCFGAALPSPACGRGVGGEGAMLNGQPMAAIHADLTGSATVGVDLTLAKPLLENLNTAFQGPVKAGAFDIPGEQARAWLNLPNPHGRSNSKVLRPWANGMDITRRLSDTRIIDFGGDLSEQEAALYEMPFESVRLHVKPERDKNRDANRKKHWWRLGRTGGDMRKALMPLSRYIATPRVAKHRLFIWLSAIVLPDSRVYAIARDDDATFGILHSRIHELWSLATCSWHGVGNDPTYNAHSCFETFPFPDGLQPNQSALSPTLCPQAGEGLHIAEAVRALNELRDN